jgi:iron complex transport system substrate-binding protein
MAKIIRQSATAILSLIFFALSLASSSFADSSSAKHPLRIASTNLCTDQFLLQIAPRERIISISYLAVDPDYSAMWEAAENIPINHGLAEEIIPLKPDLVLTTPYTPGNATRLLLQQGFNVAELELPNTIDEMVTFTEKMGELLGEKEKANILAAQLRARLEVLEKNRQDHGTALVYAPNGYTGGAETLKDEIMTRAGWKNLATEIGMKGYGNLPLESLVRNPPDLLIFDNSTRDTNSRAQQLLNHPALKKIQEHQSIKLPSHLWLCATPNLIDTIEQLAALPPRK